MISQVSLLLFVPRRGVAAFMARFLSERVFWRCREHSKIWESFGCFLSYRTVIPQCDTTAQLYTTYKLILRRDFPSLSHSSVYTAVRKKREKNVRQTWFRTFMFSLPRSLQFQRKNLNPTMQFEKQNFDLLMQFERQNFDLLMQFERQKLRSTNAVRKSKTSIY